MTTLRPAATTLLAVILAALSALVPAAAQKPPESFGEEVVVRETSVVALPRGRASDLPASGEVSVTVDGLPRQVTRVESLREDRRGDWHFLIYVDPELAGARTRYLATLALAQRAEDLAALGTVEVVVAGAGKRALERTDSWQRIEAALLSHALEARHRLYRGDPPRARPDLATFEPALARLLETTGELEGRASRVLLLISDGLYSIRGAEVVEPAGRSLAAAGWIVVPLAWTEEPSEASAARLSEFESWRQGAEGRDVSAGTRRYVIDFGRVFRRLTGAAPREAGAAELEPELLALQNLAGPTSGVMVRREAELAAALGNLARRWRIWFQTRLPGGGEPLPLEVRLGGERLEAPAWFVAPPLE